MEVISSNFLQSNTDFRKCPPPDRPEYAFIGRSNVGKSSLINKLVRKKNLAKTSQTPGKTQTINHFDINGTWLLADLPGYGYTRTGKTLRYTFSKMITTYLLGRQNLLSTFVLVDARHESLANDIDFIEWMAVNQLPFVLVFTKADKLSNTQLNTNVAKYKDKLYESWEELPMIIVTSAETGLGREEILGFIDETNKIYRK